MIAVIVCLDQILWRPIIVWADKFKFEQVESSGAAQTTLLNLIGRASIVLRLYRLLIQPVFTWLNRTFSLGARRAAETFSAPKQHRLRGGIAYLLTAGVLVGLGFAVFHAVRELSDLHREDYWELLESAALTFLRVNTALILGALWTVPAGVAIGSNPRLARYAQPLVQMAASIPATALFPIIRYRTIIDKRETGSGYDSSLNREEARRYRRRHSKRLMSTTTLAMMSVEASSTSKRPESLALLMVLPSPGVETIFPWK